MSIVQVQAARIRTDTVATVVNKGLLGDKMIQLSVGSPKAPRLDPHALIPSEEPADVFSAFNKVAAEAEQAIQNLEPLAKALGDARLSDDVKDSVGDIRAMLDAIVQGNGPIHHLFFDRQQAERVNDLLDGLNQASARLDATLGDVQDLADHVRRGPGIAHALIYDGEMSKEVAGSMVEIHADLRAIREGNGLAHALLYGDGSVRSPDVERECDERRLAGDRRGSPRGQGHDWRIARRPHHLRGHQKRHRQCRAQRSSSGLRSILDQGRRSS